MITKHLRKLDENKRARITKNECGTIDGDNCNITGNSKQGISLASIINLFGDPSIAGNPDLGVTSASTVTVDPQLMLLAFGTAILLGALGSLYPACRAAKIRPAEAMRYG